MSSSDGCRTWTCAGAVVVGLMLASGAGAQEPTSSPLAPRGQPQAKELRGREVRPPMLLPVHFGGRDIPHPQPMPLGQSGNDRRWPSNPTTDRGGRPGGGAGGVPGGAPGVVVLPGRRGGDVIGYRQGRQWVWNTEDRGASADRRFSAGIGGLVIGGDLMRRYPWWVWDRSWRRSWYGEGTSTVVWGTGVSIGVYGGGCGPLGCGWWREPTPAFFDPLTFLSPDVELLGFDPTQEPAPVPPPVPLEQGFEALGQGEFSQAVVHLRAHLSGMPGDVVAQRALGFALIGDGQFAEGVSTVEAAYLADPTLAWRALEAEVARPGRMDVMGRAEQSLQFARRTKTTGAYLVAILLYQGNERLDVARRLMGDYGQLSPNAAVFDQLGRALGMPGTAKPAGGGAVPPAGGQGGGPGGAAGDGKVAD